MKYFVDLCILITVLQLPLDATTEYTTWLSPPEQCALLTPPGFMIGVWQNSPTCEDYGAHDTDIGWPGGICCQYGPGWPPCESSGQLAGQCLYPADVLNENCDFIINETIHEDVICGFGQYCCIDCNNQTLSSTCHDEAGYDTVSRRICCPEEFGRGLLKGGCRCCGPCKRTTYCRRHGGFCVSKYDEVKNFAYCHEIGWRLIRSQRRGCRGTNCGCCAPKR